MRATERMERLRASERAVARGRRADAALYWLANAVLLVALAAAALLADRFRDAGSGLETSAPAVFVLPAVLLSGAALFVLAARGRSPLAAFAAPFFLLAYFFGAPSEHGSDVRDVDLLFWSSVALFLAHAGLLLVGVAPRDRPSRPGR